jgi:TonB family protein
MKHVETRGSIMKATRGSCRVAFALLALLSVFPARSFAQDELARAKDLYSSADFDAALALLDRLQQQPDLGATTDVAQYRVFCLLALERTEEAREAIADLINVDPFFQPSEQQTSPRIRAAFQQMRGMVLPNVLQHVYADARAAFDRKDPDTTAKFERVLKLLDDPDLQGAAVSPDFRTLVSGFRDLSRALAATNQAPAKSPGPVAAASAAPTAPAPGASQSQAGASRPSTAREGDADVVPPVAIVQSIPRGLPTQALERGSRRTIEITIDEGGNVANARLRQSVSPAFDTELLKAVREWKYKPATFYGVPIRFLKVVDIQLDPARQ